MKCLLTFAVTMLLIQCCMAESRLTHLCVNRMEKPMGIERTAFFSWQIESEDSTCTQQAYALRAAASLQDLQQGTNLMAMTERTESSESQQVPYQGRRFPPMSNVYWQAEVWLSNGEHIQCEPQHIITGLEPKHWKGQWLKNPGQLQHTFSIDDRAEQALLYIAQTGKGNCLVNGQLASDSLMGTPQQLADHTIYYHTYDVTRLVQRGKNTIVVRSETPDAITRVQLYISHSAGTTLVNSDFSWTSANGTAQPAPYPHGELRSMPAPEICSLLEKCVLGDSMMVSDTYTLFREKGDRQAVMEFFPTLTEYMRAQEHTAHDSIGTIRYHDDLRMMCHMAGALGRNADENYYRTLLPRRTPQRREPARSEATNIATKREL